MKKADVKGVPSVCTCQLTSTGKATNTNPEFNANPALVVKLHYFIVLKPVFSLLLMLLFLTQ